jgi:hypothetical protein
LKGTLRCVKWCNYQTHAGSVDSLFPVTPQGELMPVPIAIQCPDELGPLIIKEATSRGITVQAVIIDRLAESYRVTCELPKRGRRWPKKAEEEGRK